MLSGEAHASTISQTADTSGRARPIFVKFLRMGGERSGIGSLFRGMFREADRRGLHGSFTLVMETFSIVTKASPSDDDKITTDKIKDVENARAAYSALTTRAQSYNALQWQTPALAVAAEAFLLQIALGPQSTPPARLVASALNFMLSLLCIHLLLKHRQMQVKDRETLIELEKLLGLPTYHSKPRLDDLPRWIQFGSTKLWSIGFAGLGLVAVGIFSVTLSRFPW